MQRFQDQVAIVTGSGSGIGRAIAARLSSEGAAVCVADINYAAASGVAEEARARGGQAQAHEVDVTSNEEVLRMVSWVTDNLGPVGILVNNAAFVNDAPFDQLTEQDWDRDLGVVLKAPFLCARAVLPGMVERGGGVIVNLGSVNGAQYFGHDAYSAGKAGLVSLTRSIAVRYGRFGVRANVLAPGTVRTAAWDARLAQNPQLLENLAKWYPLGRVGTVDDIAAAAAFLASGDASWVTGTVLNVDGGLLAGNMVMANEIVGPSQPSAAPTRSITS